MVPKRVRHARNPVSPGAKVELLFVAWTVGDVALAIDAEDRSVGVGDGDAVVVDLSRALEERNGDDHAELAGELREVLDCGVVLRGPRPLEEDVALLAAEVRSLEELGRKDHLRPASGGPADVRRHARARSPRAIPPSGAWIAPT